MCQEHFDNERVTKILKRVQYHHEQPLKHCTDYVRIYLSYYSFLSEIIIPKSFYFQPPIIRPYFYLCAVYVNHSNKKYFIYYFDNLSAFFSSNYLATYKTGRVVVANGLCISKSFHSRIALNDLIFQCSLNCKTRRCSLASNAVLQLENTIFSKRVTKTFCNEV